MKTHAPFRIARLRSGLPSLAIALCLPMTAACCSARAAYDLWKINADGSGLALFAAVPGYSCGSPDWSPDGTLIAYDMWPNGSPFSESNIAVIRADGTGSKTIGNGGMPSWSPDGKLLVCHAYDNPTSIVVMNADGSGREVLSQNWGSPRWSPKRNRIAFILNGRIAIHDLTTGTYQSILRERYNLLLGFSISPDGSRFCFGDRQNGLLVATLDESTMTAKVRRLLKNGEVDHTSWSPDGRHVVFCWHPDNKNGQLYIMEVDGNDPPRWLQGQHLDRHNTNADWSPDGKTIIFTSGPAVESP